MATGFILFRKGETIMNNKRKIEIFSAGCSVCEETIQMVNTIACPSCDVEVLDMRQDDVAARAKQSGIKSVPAIVVDGKLADCCTGRGVDEAILRDAGVGVPLA
jgi:glutaredoxin 3